MIGQFRNTYTVQHLKLQCERSFDDVQKMLARILPKLDPILPDKLREADASWVAKERVHGNKLWLFTERDHGSLLAAEGRPSKAIQYEIGNPLTAESMTREVLSAALYAPLRVLLYEDADGTTFFEYDLPSSLFGQFGNSVVAEVSFELDRELLAVLLKAATI